MKNKIRNLLFESRKGKIKLNDKASIFFFCLLLSTFFWFLTSLSKEYVTSLSIPLNYTSYNKKFILTSAPADHINVRVRGNGFELLGEQMGLDEKYIEINLENVRQVGKNRYGFSTNILRREILKFIDKDLSFVEIQKDSIVFETQPRVSKELALRPVLQLDFKSSFNLMGEVLVEPEKIIVSGAEQRMDSLEFISTDEIQYNSLEDTVVREINLKEIEAFKDLEFNPSKVKITIPVAKFTEKMFELPVQVTSTSGNLDIKTFPDKVKVVFLVPLNHYEQFIKDELHARVKVDEKVSEKKKLAVKISGVPSFAKLLRTEPEKVEFIIKK